MVDKVDDNGNEVLRGAARINSALGKYELSQFPTDDYYLSIVKGKIPNHARIAVAGHDDSVGTNIATLWALAGDVPQPLATAVTMTVSSTDANDTSAGTGAQAIFITGVTNGYVLATETVATDGLTEVTTVNTYIHINEITIPPGFAGSTRSNIGTIYIGTGTVTAGVPATPFNFIAPIESVSRSGFYSVPAGKFLSVTNLLYTIESNKTATLIIRSTINGVTYIGNEIHSSGAIPFPLSVSTALIFPKTFLDVAAKVDSGSAVVDASFGIIELTAGEVDTSVSTADVEPFRSS